MIFLLDTNVCIKYLNGTSPEVRSHLQSKRPDEIRMCSVVKSELFAGAGKSSTPEKTIEKQRLFLTPFVSLPFDDAAAEVYGRIRSELERRGVPIGPYDMQIAAIALVNQCVLVTHNMNEFSRIAGLDIEDWEA